MDCKKIKLSILIPVYNTQPYLERCLKSVEEAVDGIEDQIEVLVINDGSTDGSDSIIQAYCEKHVWMRRFDKPNGGLSDVKNYGLERAGGEYVIFLDSDDYVEPPMYKEMLKKAEEEAADIVVCDIRLVYDDPAQDKIWPCTVPARDGVFAQVMDMTMMPASWNKIIKKELYNGLPFPKGWNNEDVAVTPIVLARAETIAVINKAYYNYYQRSGSIQNGSFDERRFVILRTAKVCVDRLDGVEPQKQEIIKGSVYLHQILGIAFYPIRTEPFVRRYRLLKRYMTQVQELFPDIWDNFEVKEFVTWEGKYMQAFRRISCVLLKHGWYGITSAFWTVVNILYAYHAAKQE